MKVVLDLRVPSRYSRNISLFGQDGQEILLDAKVLVIGAGGLGSPLLYYLAANGIGTIGIVDDDVVSLSDLQRQILYSTEMLHGAKVEHAKAVLNKLNPDCHVIACKSLIQGKIDIIDDFDIVVECSDNFETKFLLNQQCYLKNKPLVIGAAIAFEGYAGLFKPYCGKHFPCYQCFCPTVPDEVESLQSCATQGVFNAATGVIGSLQATMVIHELLQLSAGVADKLTRVNLLNYQFKRSIITVNDQCLICQGISCRC